MQPWLSLTGWSREAVQIDPIRARYGSSELERPLDGIRYHRKFSEGSLEIDRSIDLLEALAS